MLWSRGLDTFQLRAQQCLKIQRNFAVNLNEQNVTHSTAENTTAKQTRLQLILQTGNHTKNIIPVAAHKDVV